MGFGICLAQTLKLSSEMIKNWKIRLIFHDFVTCWLFRYFCSTACWTLAIQNRFFPNEKKYSYVSIYASRGGSWEKIIQRLQIDCDHT